MSFLWPSLLWSLAAVPLLAALYLWLMARRRRTATRYANLSMAQSALGPPGWGRRLRRYTPPLLFLLAIGVMLASLARPAAVILIPSQHEVVILAIDVSGSMRATDVKPTRLAAAQAAAKAFVADQPAKTRIGIVAFAGAAALVQSPTQNREEIYEAIDRFQMQRGTAVGSAIVIALAAIFPSAGIAIDQLPSGREGGPNTKPAPIDPFKSTEKKEWKPVPPGSYGSAAIVLLSDGVRTAGPDAQEAAKMAADRGVKVFTVGVGTKEGTTLNLEGFSMRVRLDEDGLKKIAATTHGEYFQATSSNELKKVYQALNARLVFEKKESEVTALFAAVAAVLAAISALLSLNWFNRIL